MPCTYIQPTNNYQPSPTSTNTYQPSPAIGQTGGGYSAQDGGAGFSTTANQNGSMQQVANLYRLAVIVLYAFVLWLPILH